MTRENSWPLKISLLILLLCTPANLFAQASKAVALRVSGEVPTHLELGVADIAALPRQTIRVTDDKGAQVEYGGVAVAEILKKAGAPLGKELKGPNLAVGVIAGAPDGYRVLFSLTEFDPAFSDRVILLADRREGKPLDNREGPLRLIVPGDKRHARWIRGVTTIEVFKGR
jgi:DMSO/TMAO reductase YedYZ molybdopterin-dependent catalytic subunit